MPDHSVAPVGHCEIVDYELKPGVVRSRRDLVGLLIGTIAFGQAWWVTGTLNLALTFAVTICAICVWSTTVGAIIPITAYRLGIDPAALWAPLITTLVDATGLLIYLTIAKMIRDQI